MLALNARGLGNAITDWYQRLNYALTTESQLSEENIALLVKNRFWNASFMILEGSTSNCLQFILIIFPSFFSSPSFIVFKAVLYRNLFLK